MENTSELSVTNRERSSSINTISILGHICLFYNECVM